MTRCLPTSTLSCSSGEDGASCRGMKCVAAAAARALTQSLILILLRCKFDPFLIGQ